MGFGEIIIFDFRGRGPENAGNIFRFGDETSEANGGIFWGLILEIGRFMGFVDDDEPEIF